ncbi:tetratricopeptide repeat protein [Pelagicoccus mobilis]|uniref:Tetratricopeptide repeat protein n=1 Tax=Pelagicoccus mobilis TaxID=415221 RepID=A0A934S3B8_9BACT|nr:hypothetical protein [Pelagicoccus mobilis]MBK1878649.1 hypothetical protein [Pelagicoccus mobilis]
MAEVPLKELDRRVRKQFENARIAVERGNFEYTIEICSSILAENPGCLEVRHLLRQAQQSVFAKQGRGFLLKSKLAVEVRTLVVYGKPYIKKNPGLAMQYGERALSRNPVDAGALSLVAAGAEELGLYETAVFCLQNICDSETKDFALMKRYCEALIQIGETNQAVSIAERLKQLKPENSIIQELVKSASVAHSINKGKWAEEEQDFRSKLRDEDLAGALERENRLIQDSDDLHGKARELVDAIHRDPQDLDLYKELVKVYLFTDEYREALVWLDKAAQLPQATADVVLKQLRSEIMIKATELDLQKLLNESKGDEDSVERIQKLEHDLELLKLEESRKLVEQFPNDYGQRLSFGELLLSAGQVDEAIREFQVAQRSNSLKQRAFVMLGRSFSKKRLFDLALEQFDQAIAETPGMDDFKKDVIYSSAECCEAIGDKEDAIRRYKLIYANDISFRDVANKIDRFYSSEEA